MDVRNITAWRKERGKNAADSPGSPVNRPTMEGKTLEGCGSFCRRHSHHSDRQAVRRQLIYLVGEAFDEMAENAIIDELTFIMTICAMPSTWPGDKVRRFGAVHVSSGGNVFYGAKRKRCGSHNHRRYIE